jgi:hypothetical protein
MAALSVAALQLLPMGSHSLAEDGINFLVPYSVVDVIQDSHFFHSAVIVMGRATYPDSIKQNGGAL